mmetsp:Transcript_2231/g.7222  ORF Transcript_2231/g.7222 Transcript_2231/m.7222 type:complete len:148 (-) Transcript_2231:1154-1597(-)
MVRLLATVLCALLSCAEAFRPAPRAWGGHVAARSSVRMAVSKGDLVDAIAARAGVSKKMAGAVLSSALDVIVESVADGNKVSLVGFGTFDSKERAAREGRNPQTGEKMQIAATVAPTFSFGKGFKDACKRSYSASVATRTLNGHEAP